MSLTTANTPTRWTIVIGVAALAAGLIAGPVLAGALNPGRAVPVTNGITDGTTPEHTISVSGSGKVVVTPDMATVRLGVVIERETAKQAREAAAERMSNVIAALKKLGIKDEDIATGMISLGPVYDYSVSGNARIRGYQLSNLVTVTVRDLTKVSDVLDDTVIVGATTVDGISFDIADRTAAEAKAREAAVKDAKAKAQTLADGVGAHISGVAQMSESVSTPVWYDKGFAPSAGADGAAQTPVMPGSQDVVITVQVSFLID